MSYIPAKLRRLVVARAKNRCEYCGLSQEGQVATFHIDHIVPSSKGGETIAENLALACVACSLHKAARLTAVDPLTNDPTPIFNPRQDRWDDHFRWNDVHMMGLTAIGQATIRGLQLNRDLMLAIRAEEKLIGRHPAG
ncbi:MAG TPA: HNH endonuclease signature motif containing protein [Chloroflexota bacterium]|nr:HNH endonuclease signature motif containing protein [Chloroflexota bacterium]HUM71998.1 HNH endonuclease signature motif containing protein [Chloroflexota bacterium]